MPLLPILKSAMVATANGLTLLAICPPHIASAEEGDRMMEDVTSPERLLATDRTPWVERLVVFGMTAYEIWSLRQGNGKIDSSSARIGELGVLLAIAGAVLRLRCYQVLGRFFTFKVSDTPWALTLHSPLDGVVITHKRRRRSPSGNNIVSSPVHSLTTFSDTHLTPV